MANLRYHIHHSAYNMGTVARCTTKGCKGNIPHERMEQKGYYCLLCEAPWMNEDIHVGKRAGVCRNLDQLYLSSSGQTYVQEVLRPQVLQKMLQGDSSHLDDILENFSVQGRPPKAGAPFGNEPIDAGPADLIAK